MKNANLYDLRDKLELSIAQDELLAARKSIRKVHNRINQRASRLRHHREQV